MLKSGEVCTCFPLCSVYVWSSLLAHLLFKHSLLHGTFPSEGYNKVSLWAKHVTRFTRFLVHRPIQESFCNDWYRACYNDYFCSADDGNFFSCARCVRSQCCHQYQCPPLQSAAIPTCRQFCHCYYSDHLSFHPAPCHVIPLLRIVLRLDFLSFTAKILLPVRSKLGNYWSEKGPVSKCIYRYTHASVQFCVNPFNG